MQHVRDDWEAGWIICARVNVRLSTLAGLRAMGNMGQVAPALVELEAEGMVERRKGPGGFMQWRRVQPVQNPYEFKGVARWPTAMRH